MEKGPDEKAKRKVPVDLEDLCMAFEDSSTEHSYYLNMDTGQVELRMSDSMDLEDEQEMARKFEADNYLPVPSADTHEAYGDMQDFAWSVKDKHLAEKLDVALNGRGAFRRFKDVLLDHPDECQRWFEFRDKKVQERVMDWLESEGIEPVEPPPIEITEVSIDGFKGNDMIIDGWEDFGPAMCLKCENKVDLTQRCFIISREPKNSAEEELLKDALKSKYHVEHHGIVSGAFGDKRGLVTTAICGKCGSQDVVFDF